jgi:Bacterial nucleoid DNA-binding protein
MKSNSKITIQDLVDLLCEKSEVNKQQAENFIKSLFAVIEEKLLTGENVKINNFGVFKMQWNEPRKSVNINTGEEFVIEGFQKLVFIPEQKLKDAVNAPFTHLEPIILDEDAQELQSNDPLYYFRNQATEIKSILSEISAINEIKEEETEIIEIQEEVNEEEINEEDVNLAEDIIVVDEEKTEVTETQEEVNEVIVENIQIDDINIEEENLEIITEQKNKKKLDKVKKNNKHYGVKYSLLIIVVIIIGVKIAYFSSSCFECWVRYDLLNEKGRQNLSNIENTISNWFSGRKSVTEDLNNKPETNATSEGKIETIIPEPEIIDEIPDSNLTSDKINAEADKTPKNDDVQPKDDLNSKKGDTQPKVDSNPKKDDVKPNADANSKKEDTTQNTDAQKADTSPQNDAVQTKTDNKSDNNNSLEQLFKGPRVYNEFIATETIGRNVSLTLLAHKYYGDRDFWVYIHEANSNKYENPGNIPAGVEISVPKLDKRLIDTSNPLCKEKARELQGKYMKN